MDEYLNLFEQAIKKQAELVGIDTALTQAKKAGLGVSKSGHIISCAGNPQVVLLRLINYFTAGGNLEALVECSPLIQELLKQYDEAEAEAENQQAEATNGAR
jgi:hypothetical protein